MTDSNRLDEDVRAEARLVCGRTWCHVRGVAAQGIRSPLKATTEGAGQRSSCMPDPRRDRHPPLKVPT